MLDFIRKGLLCAGLFIAFSTASLAQWDYNVVNATTSPCQIELVAGWSCSPCAYDLVNPLATWLGPGTTATITPPLGGCTPFEFAAWGFALWDSSNNFLGQYNFPLSCAGAMPMGSFSFLDCTGNPVTVTWTPTPTGYDILFN